MKEYEDNLIVAVLHTEEIEIHSKIGEVKQEAVWRILFECFCENVKPIPLIVGFRNRAPFLLPL